MSCQSSMSTVISKLIPQVSVGVEFASAQGLQLNTSHKWLQTTRKWDFSSPEWWFSFHGIYCTSSKKDFSTSYRVGPELKVFSACHPALWPTCRHIPRLRCRLAAAALPSGSVISLLSHLMCSRTVFFVNVFELDSFPSDPGSSVLPSRLSEGILTQNSASFPIILAL